MTTNEINFFQQKNTNEILSQTFSFFFKEIKNLYKPFVFYVFPFLALNEILKITFGVSAELLSNPEFIFSTNFAILTSISFLGTVMMSSIISAYIKQYLIHGKDNFTEQDVWKSVSQFYPKALLAQVLFAILTVAGLLFFFVPGIYLAVVSVFSAFIVFIEEKGAADTVKRSFTVIKNNWWQTFGTIFFLGIIFISISFMINVGFQLLPKQTFEPEFSMYRFFYFLTESAMMFFFGSVYQIFIAGLYFKYVDEKEYVSLRKKIDEIAENTVHYDKEKGISFEEIHKYDQDFNTSEKNKPSSTDLSKSGNNDDRFKPKL